MEGDLTTDAYPSAPRDEKPTNTDVNNEQNRKQRDNSTIKHSTRLKNKKTAPSKFPTHSYANVINIVNSENVHVGRKTSYTYTNCSKHEEGLPKSGISKTKEIEKLFECEKPLDREYILYIYEHIPHWKDIARKLDYSEGQICQFYENYFVHGGIKEVIYHFLLDWTQNQPKQATLGKLGQVLWASEQRDATQRLAKKVFLE